MPSIGGMIGGTITFLIGAFIFSYFRGFGDYMEQTSFRWKWETWKTPLHYQIGAFFAGLGLMAIGLNTWHFGVISMIMLILSIPVLLHYKVIGHVLLVFFSRREPSESKIQKGQNILLLLALAWSGWAIYLSVTGWFE
ncbi:MAG: hypothetical protein JW712_06010 [Dehalococcoidales bacterium]|nr:hypothetical protein [Dehalococcoidales bacterium]